MTSALTAVGDRIRSFGAADDRVPGPPLPVRRLLVLALAGSFAVLLLVLVDVDRFGGNPVSLVQPGSDGPSAEVFARDFPETELPDGTGHDGQQFYAIARQPMHLKEVAPDLDRPRYRLQRPLLPWLAWAVHPGGGGVGLVYAFLLVGLGALVVGGMSLGAISVTLGGRAWPALAFPLLPGGYVCLRISVADTLSVALALLAIALALRSRLAQRHPRRGARGAGQGDRGAPVPGLRPVAARPAQRRAGGDPARRRRRLVGRAPRAPARWWGTGRRNRRAIPRPGQERS